MIHHLTRLAAVGRPTAAARPTIGRAMAVAVVVGTVLASGVVASGVIGDVAVAADANPAWSRAGATEVPCPVVPVARTGARPDPAPPPVRDPARPIVGGNPLGTPGLVVPTGSPALPATLSATSWLVADLDTGAVLGGCGPHEYRAPASIQ